MDNPIKNIELRSEEVQYIMGKMPPSILRWGTSVIALVVLIMLVGSYLFRYPETIACRVVVTEAATYMSVPANAIEKVKVGQKVILQLDNFPYQEFGSITGYVLYINPRPLSSGFYQCVVQLPNGMKTNTKRVISSKLKLIGKGELTLSEQRLLIRFFGSLH